MRASPMRLHILPLASSLLLTSLAAVFAVPSSGCATTTDEGQSTAQASTADDLILAKAMVSLIAGEEGHCKDCHTIDAAKFRGWGNKMKDVEAACFAPSLAAKDRINCLRSTPTDP